MSSLPRVAIVGLVLLRLYAGAFWLEKGIRQKLLDPTWVGPRGDCALVVHDMLSKAPGWYHVFLQGVVWPNVSAFSVMIEWGETLVGLSLLLGLLSRAGAIGGLFLSLNYWLGNGAGALDDSWFGFDTTTFMMTSVHAIIPTGLVLGLDALLQRRRSVLHPIGPFIKRAR